ncbi:MAG: hypothetical protein PBU96_12195, partial [Stenotrophomonas geniculata]
GQPYNNYLYNAYGRAIYVQAKYEFGGRSDPLTPPCAAEGPAHGAFCWNATRAGQSWRFHAKLTNRAPSFIFRSSSSQTAKVALYMKATRLFAHLGAAAAAGPGRGPGAGYPLPVDDFAKIPAIQSLP